MVSNGGERRRGKIREHFRSPDKDWKRPKLVRSVEMGVGNLGGKLTMAEKSYNSVMLTVLLLEPGILLGTKYKFEKYHVKRVGEAHAFPS